eukprot:48304-Chlamydomonas_euryale.AAC.1
MVVLVLLSTAVFVIAHRFDAEPLLACVTMGMVVTNRRHERPEDKEELHSMLQQVCGRGVLRVLRGLGGLGLGGRWAEGDSGGCGVGGGGGGGGGSGSGGGGGGGSGSGSGSGNSVAAGAIDALDASCWHVCRLAVGVAVGVAVGMALA